VIYFCDERILVSNEDDGRGWIDLLVQAEHCSRQLARRGGKGHRQGEWCQEAPLQALRA